MPYLQFELPARVPAEKKRALALRAGALYADLMQTSISVVKVAFRDLGAGNLFRLLPDGGTLESVVVIQCDVRRGRSVSERRAFSAALSALASEFLGVPPDSVEIEFTQHAGDEMYRRGGFAADWSEHEHPTSGRAC